MDNTANGPADMIPLESDSREQVAAAPLPPTLLTPDLNHAVPLVPPNANRLTKLLPPRLTDHIYQDYSTYPVEHCPTNMKPSTNFPTQLHEILSTPKYSHIISWMPHGRAWKVHKRDLLVSEVLPEFFSQTIYRSFTRQLSGYGLKRLQQPGKDHNAFYHECFLRGLPHLVGFIKRVQGNLGKQISNVGDEPNFYEMSLQFPLPDDVKCTSEVEADAQLREGGIHNPPSTPPVVPPATSSHWASYSLSTSDMQHKTSCGGYPPSESYNQQNPSVLNAYAQTGYSQYYPPPTSYPPYGYNDPGYPYHPSNYPPSNYLPPNHYPPPDPGLSPHSQHYNPYCCHHYQYGQLPEHRSSYSQYEQLKLTPGQEALHDGQYGHLTGYKASLGGGGDEAKEEIKPPSTLNARFCPRLGPGMLSSSQQHYPFRYHYEQHGRPPIEKASYGGDEAEEEEFKPPSILDARYCPPLSPGMLSTYKQYDPFELHGQLSAHDTLCRGIAAADKFQPLIADQIDHSKPSAKGISKDRGHSEADPTLSKFEGRSKNSQGQNQRVGDNKGTRRGALP